MLAQSAVRKARHTLSIPIFQKRVTSWVEVAFGRDVASNLQERNFRFLEEAVELVQALDMTREEAHKLVDYTYNRPKGDPRQEVGGVVVTLAALADQHGIDLEQCGEMELERCWSNIHKIRAKQQGKPHP